MPENVRTKYNPKLEKISELTKKLEETIIELSSKEQGHRPKNRHQLEQKIKDLKQKILELGGDIPEDDREDDQEEPPLHIQVKEFGTMIHSGQLTNEELVIKYSTLLLLIEETPMKDQEALIEELNSYFAIANDINKTLTTQGSIEQEMSPIIPLTAFATAEVTNNVSIGPIILSNSTSSIAENSYYNIVQPEIPLSQLEENEFTHEDLQNCGVAIFCLLAALIPFAILYGNNNNFFDPNTFCDTLWKQ
jgi:hypothetical protein